MLITVKNNILLVIIVIIVLPFISMLSIRKILHNNKQVTNKISNINNIKLYSNKRNRDGLGKPKGYYNSKNHYVMINETLTGLPNREKPYLVLGIESSCDDTGVSVVSSDGKILSNIIYSQSLIHEQYGGVVPSLAMNAHKDVIDKAISEAITAAGLSSLDDIDAVAVTKGPGLEICLRVGFRKAQSIAQEYNKPFVTVHHLEAHCLLARLIGKEITNDSNQDNSESNINNEEDFEPKVQFPFLTLLASGGHTSIMLCNDVGDYTVLGATLDDALGEAFDKASRLLGLRNASSGGVAVEQTARSAMFPRGSEGSSGMTVPMRDKPNCDFSYAGLKNSFRMAVERAREEHGYNLDEIKSTNAPTSQMETTNNTITLPDSVTSQLCADFQDVAFKHVEQRIKRALKFIDSNNNNVKPNALVVVGGVAANLELRRRLLSVLDKHSQSNNSNNKYKLIFPPPYLCTDNGVMAAWAGIEKLNRGISNNYLGEDGTIKSEDVIARWPLGMPIWNYK